MKAYKHLVKYALAQGYNISVWDGEEWQVSHSNKYQNIIDAIESGIVKVPRVPISDDSGVSEQPTYRDLWLHIKDTLPKKGRRTEEAGEEPVLPVELQGALHSLYGNYQKYFDWWANNSEAKSKGITAPVFIVVCNNTNVSKMV